MISMVSKNAKPRIKNKCKLLVVAFVVRVLDSNAFTKTCHNPVLLPTFPGTSSCRTPVKEASKKFFIFKLLGGVCTTVDFFLSNRRKYDVKAWMHMYAMPQEVSVKGNFLLQTAIGPVMNQIHFSLRPLFWIAWFQYDPKI